MMGGWSTCSKCGCPKVNSDHRCSEGAVHRFETKDFQKQWCEVRSKTMFVWIDFAAWLLTSQGKFAEWLAKEKHA